MSGFGVWVNPSETSTDSVLDWVSVVDHGAAGDGVVDDTAAIQAALDATPEGGVCYFPVGTYLITSTLTLPHAMRLLGGVGWRWARIVMDTNNTTAISGPSTIDPVDPDGSYWAIERLEIVGDFGGTETSGVGVKSVTSIQMAHARVVGFYDGLRLSASTGALQPVFYSKLDHCAFDGASRAGVRLEGIVNNFTWSDCRAMNAGVASIQIVGGPIAARFFGGDISGSPISFDIDGTDATTGQATAGVLISGAYFETNSGNTDIRIGNGSTVYSVRVESCTFIRPDYTGTGWHIDATNVDGLTVEDCEFSSDQVIRVQSPGTNVTYGRNHNTNSGTITLPSGSIRLDAANVTPEPVADTPAVGTSHYLARADHVHEGATTVSAADVRDAGRWEVVVDGNPATAVTTPDGTDWVYGWITT